MSGLRTGLVFVLGLRAYLLLGSARVLSYLHIQGEGEGEDIYEIMYELFIFFK